MREVSELHSLKFDLDDDISVSDLRGEAWPERLTEVGKLRVQRRGQTVGVLLSPHEWHALRKALDRYASLFAWVEDDADRALFLAREDGEFRGGPEQAAALSAALKKAGLLP
jgi:hypothetical protein